WLSGGSANMAIAEELRHRILSSVVTMLKGLNFTTDFIMTDYLTDIASKIFHAIKKPVFKTHYDGAIHGEFHALCALCASVDAREVGDSRASVKSDDPNLCGLRPRLLQNGEPTRRARRRLFA